MNKVNKLSHSSVLAYTTCPRKYKLYYVDRLRPKLIHGALLYGSALDHALNILVEKKDLALSKIAFIKSFSFQNINDIPTYLPETTKVVYAQRDFDFELLKQEDFEHYQSIKQKLVNYTAEGAGLHCLQNDYDYLNAIKKEKGIDALAETERVLYNLLNWLSLKRKGLITLETYYKEVLPNIKEVLAIQQRDKIVNEEGDELTYILDLAVTWSDGKRYLLDHKTSSIEYEDDSAMKSQQLVLYYHAEKERLKLDGVGFIVMYKTMIKNKKKTCSKCHKDGSGQRHKTCDKIVNEERCHGEWLEEIDPKCNIQVILNTVPSSAEDLIIQTFDEANQGIKKEAFGPNLNACGNEHFKCQYYNYCWKGSKEDLIKLEKKKDESNK